jgi:two-component system, cell cycle sensor histidine kinase and response regulator CckA
VLVSDISDRIRAQRALQDSEEQLRQAQKMEAVGRLAGGVAQDFNNLLTAIQGHAELLIGELPAGHAMAEDLEEIRRAAERATSLTRQLLAFSRRQVLQPRPLNLNAVVADMGKMLARLIGEHITVETELHPALPAVQADPVQIQQVVLNLVLNARDAMADGGTLCIRTQLASAMTPGAPAELGAGAWVLLSIEDEGHGIPPELLPNIFEPFFTTKEAGRGTGLGLSTVYGIVRQTGGHVTVQSTTSGATFGVWLPASETAPATPLAPEPRAAGHVARILLVEDESAVRQLARRILQRAGYEVLEAANARAGLQLAAAHAGSVDLLLTDMVMPELSGRELAEELATRFPRLPVLFMSGYTEDVVFRNGVHQRSMAFLEKPFSPQALLDKVRAMLETAADAAAARAANAPAECAGPD